MEGTRASETRVEEFVDLRLTVREAVGLGDLLEYVTRDSMEWVDFNGPFAPYYLRNGGASTPDEDPETLGFKVARDLAVLLSCSRGPLLTHADCETALDDEED